MTVEHPGAPLNSFRFSRILRSGATSLEGRNEGGAEVQSPVKIFDRIRFRFSKNARADQIKHHLADIVRSSDSPVFQDRDDHRSKLFQSELSESIEQLSGV